MGYALRAQEWASWTPLAHRRRLPALLCALATVLSLTLSACASVGPPADSTPTPTLPRVGYCAGRAGRDRDPSSYVLAVTSPPIAADGVVYVSYAIPDTEGNPDRHQYAIAALRTRDGLPLWRVRAAGKTSILAVADGVLVVYVYGSGLVGLRAKDGTSRWHMDLDSAGGTLMGGVLYMIASGLNANENLYALRVADGHMLWHSPVLQGLIPLTVVDGTAVYVAVADGSVVAVQADTGAIRWTAFPGSTPTSPAWYIPLAAASGQLYVTTDGELGKEPGVLRLNTADGTSGGYILRLPTDTEVLSPILMAGVYFAIFIPGLPPGARPPAPPPTIVAYRLRAGGSELLWRVRVQGDHFAATSVAHDSQTLYFLALSEGVISAFRLADGALLWRQQALASAGIGIVADSGYLVEYVSGVDNPCHTPAIHQAPQIRMLSTTDGSVVWIQALDVPH